MTNYLQQSSDLVSEKSSTISLTSTPQEPVTKTAEKGSENAGSLNIAGTMQALDQMTTSCMIDETAPTTAISPATEENAPTSQYGFSTSLGTSHMMGGNSIGVAIASLNHAQELMLEVNLSWLQQNRLSFTAGTSLSLSELKDMQASAEEQKNSGYYEAYQMFAQGGTAAAGVGMTMAQTRQERQGFKTESANVDREHNTLDLLNRAEKKAANPDVVPSNDPHRTLKSDIKTEQNKVIQSLVKKQPATGETRVNQDINKALDDAGFEKGATGKKYVLDDAGDMMQHGTNFKAEVGLTRVNKDVRIDENNKFIDNKGYVLKKDGDNYVRDQKEVKGIFYNEKKEYKSDSNYIQENGEGNKVTPKNIDNSGFIVENNQRIGQVRFVTRDEVITGDVQRNNGTPTQRTKQSKDDLDHETFYQHGKDKIRFWGEKPEQQLDYRNKHVVDAMVDMKNNKTAEFDEFRAATQKRYKDAFDSRGSHLGQFNGTLQMNNALYGAMGNFAGGALKIVSSDYSYEAQKDGATSRYEGTMANQFFSFASNWQSQASKAYDQSLSALSGPLDALRRAVSRG
jgi:hypothetical protein